MFISNSPSLRMLSIFSLASGFRAPWTPNCILFKSFATVVVGLHPKTPVLIITLFVYGRKLICSLRIRKCGKKLTFQELNQKVSTVKMRSAKSLPKDRVGHGSAGWELTSMKILKHLQKNYFGQKETNQNETIDKENHRYNR